MVYVVWESPVWFLRVGVQFFQRHLLRRLSAPWCIDVFSSIVIDNDACSFGLLPNNEIVVDTN